MADFPALPLWTDAYLADTGHLTNHEHGIYLRTLMLMWRQPNCRIPYDAPWVARHLSFTETDAEAFGRIAAEFLEVLRDDGTWWIQKRLRQERDYVAKKSKKQSRRAKSRWNKEKGVSRGNAEAMPRDGTWHEPGIAPTPTPTPTPLKESPLPPKGELVDLDFEKFWQTYPRRVSKGQAAKAWRTSLKKTTASIILAAAERYARQSVGKDPTYLKHPATWLNGECWADEESAAPSANLGRAWL